jgi:hypothetical protein
VRGAALYINTYHNDQELDTTSSSMFSPIHSVMDTVLISHMASLTRNVVSYSSVLRNHLIIPSSHHPVGPGFKLVYITYIGATQRSPTCVPPPVLLKLHASLYSIFPYISLQSSSHSGNRTFGSDNHVTTLASIKRFGLAVIGRWGGGEYSSRQRVGSPESRHPHHL